MDRLLVYGRKEDIKRRPPQVTVEIYDYDKVSDNISLTLYLSLCQFNKAEFIGRTFAPPLVHLDDEMVNEINFYLTY